MKMWQLRQLGRDELLHHKRELEEEIFNLRMQRGIKPPTNPRRISQLRHELSRILTILSEDKLGIRKMIGSEETE